MDGNCLKDNLKYLKPSKHSLMTHKYHGINTAFAEICNGLFVSHASESYV